MITCNLMGGLGNQLFQIFATISYAIEYNQSFKFINTTILKSGIIRNTFWNSLLYRLRLFLFDIYPSNNTTVIYKEPDFTYKKIPPLKQLLYQTKTNKNTNNQNIIENVILNGYFQSELYFKGYFPTIYKLLDINTQTIQVVDKIQPYLKHPIHKYCSIHFRRGDYKTLPDHHPVLSFTYYKNAISYLVKNTKTETPIIHFLVFTDEKGEDYKTLFQKLVGSEEETEETKDASLTAYFYKNGINIEFHRVPNNIDIADWEELLLMSMCGHNIICNSSFSWWGAYMNKHQFPSKQIIYPSKWFGSAMAHMDTTFLCPPEWKCISCDCE